jgi:hypothetical protein
MTSQEKRKEARPILQFHVPLYIDDVFSLNNSKFDDFSLLITSIALSLKYV